MAYKRRRGGRLSRGDYKLLSRAKRARMRQTILSTVRPYVIGARGGQDSKDYFGLDYPTSSAEQRLNRLKWGFRGKGKYSVRQFMGDVGRIGEGIKRTYNSWIPKSIRDQAIGIASQKLGSFGGSGLYTGRGSYAANELIDGGMQSMGVVGSGDETEAICISNREYVSDVYGPPSSQFYNQTFTINPGEQQNFPFLAQIAANYEEYEFTKLIFMYRSTIDVGNTTTAGQTGTLLMACDYNASHQPFTAKDQMMTYHGAVSSKATEDCVCGIECDPNKGKTLATYVRTGPVPYGEDPKTYDLGLFQFALNNVPEAMQNQQLGELWVEYSCILRKPKLGVSRGVTIQKDMYINSDGAATRAPDYRDFATAPAGAGVLGTSPYWLKHNMNNLGTRIDQYYGVGAADEAHFWYDGYTVASTGGATPIVGAMPTSNSVGLLITFPAQYSGTVAVRYQASLRAAVTGLDGIWRCYHSGNIEPVTDIWDNPSSWTTPTYVAQATDINRDLTYCEFHFRVRAATGGKDNAVCLAFDVGVSAGSVGSEAICANLTIEELNPNFNLPSDGGTWLGYDSNQVDIPFM